ncbi:MAG: hypothetical protein ABI598_05235 [Chloroflexota bacterium]
MGALQFLADLAGAGIRRLASFLGSQLPGPPPGDAPPPDVDGKRQATLNPDDLRRVELARKEGKGGYR